jgi:hypothetical protein
MWPYSTIENRHDSFLFNAFVESMRAMKKHQLRKVNKSFAYGWKNTGSKLMSD